jgi:hypothetical protein
MTPSHWHVLVGPKYEEFILPGGTTDADARLLLKLLAARGLTAREVVEAFLSPSGGLLAMQPREKGFACGDGDGYATAHRCCVNHDLK